LLAAGVVRVALVSLGVQLVAGELHLGGVDDDHVFAGIDVGRVHRAVLAAEHVGDLDRQPAHDLVGGVDDEPTLLDVVAVGEECGHGRRLPSSGAVGNCYDKWAARGVKGSKSGNAGSDAVGGSSGILGTWDAK